MIFLNLRSGAQRLSPRTCPPGSLLRTPGWFFPEEGLHARRDTHHECHPLPQATVSCGPVRAAPCGQQLPLLSRRSAPCALIRCPLLQRIPALCGSDVRPPYCSSNASSFRLPIRAVPTRPGRTLPRTELTIVHQAVRAPPELGHRAPAFHITRVNVDISLRLVPMIKAKSAGPDPALFVRVLPPPSQHTALGIWGGRLSLALLRRCSQPPLTPPPLTPHRRPWRHPRSRWPALGRTSTLRGRPERWRRPGSRRALAHRPPLPKEQAAPLSAPRAWPRAPPRLGGRRSSTSQRC